MCVIIASPHGKLLPDDVIGDAFSSNRDGGGVAWFDQASKKIRWKKGLKTAVEAQEIIAKEAAGKPWVLHARICTVGGVCPELTHPFSIDERASLQAEGEADSVLFHNGGTHNWKEILFQAALASNKKLPRHPWSDSRAMAWACHIYGPHFLSIADSSSRFLVFDGVTTDAAERMMIWGSWHPYQDFSFSNQGSKVFRTTSTTARDFSRRATHHYFPDSARSSPPVTPPVITIRDRRAKHTTVDKYDPWKSFTESGLAIRAANEEFLAEVEAKELTQS